MKAKILSLHWLFWICKSTWAFAIICAYLFRLDIAIEICPKLKDGRSASVANQTGEKPLPHRLALQIHFACLPNFKIMAAKCQKMSHFFNTALKKLGPNSGPAVFLHLLRRGTSRCSRCICFRILSSWWIFIHQKMDATKMDATNQPLGVLSVFLGLFAFRPFFHLWELRFGRLRSQWDDWITRDFKHLQGGLYEHY